MYKIPIFSKTTFKVNNTLEGESIEAKVRRIVANKEPIKDGAAMIYTEKKDGVIDAYNIRTDRWEIALDAIEKVQKATIAKNAEKAKETSAETKIEESGKSEPVDGTNG